MFDDRDGGFEGILLCWEPPLPACPRVVERVAIRGVAHRCRGAPYPDARLVHHVEHVGEPLMRFAHEFADAGPSLAEVEQRGGGPTPPHLVDQPAEGDVVRVAERAIVGVAPLGDDEERDPLGASGGPRDACEHQVHDVLGELMLSSRDPDLGPLDAIGPIGVGMRRGAQIGEGGSRVGFSERHRPTKAPIEHRREPLRLLGLGAEGCDQVRGAGGEHRIARAPDVRRLQPGDRRRGDGVGELQPTDLSVVRGCDDPRLCGGGVGGLQFGLGDDDPIDDLRLFLIVALAIWRIVPLRDFARRVEHRVVDLATLLREARAGGQCLRLEEFVQDELQITGMQERAHGR